MADLMHMCTFSLALEVKLCMCDGVIHTVQSVVIRGQMMEKGSGVL